VGAPLQRGATGQEFDLGKRQHVAAGQHAVDALARGQAQRQRAQQRVARRAVALDPKAGDGVGQPLNRSRQRRLAHAQRLHQLAGRVRVPVQQAFDLWAQGGAAGACGSGHL